MEQPLIKYQSRILRPLLCAILSMAIWPWSGSLLHAQVTNTPATPRFQVQRFEVVGSSVLDQSAVDRAMRNAIGTDIGIPQIRRSLLKLQQAYRDRGYAKAAVTLPQQPFSNGVVQVRVFEGPASFAPEAQATDLPAWTVPAYDIRHFIIYGNTVLSPEEIDQILAPAAGPTANLEALEKALARLRTAYRERGLNLVSVTLPQQLLTDGAVVVKVDEGTPSEGENSVATSKQGVSPAVPAPPKSGRSFEVNHYEVTGNTLLPEETIDQLLAPAKGTNVTIARIQKAVGDLQLAYRERGFATVGVSLPQQQLTNATVKVLVTEGRLVDVRVTGNHHYSSNNVLRALPSVQDALLWQDQVLNSRVFQRELDIANQNRDRQIYPSLSPGPDPGTTALTLKVKDRVPVHGRIEVNNQSTPGTPDWRVNASAQYKNLWQREHQAGVSYGFTPEKFKSGGLTYDYIVNRPLIANYGVYYRLPFGEAESVQQRINSSTRFGYDEATHQFRLPPAGARPDLTVYASASSSDTGLQLGERTPVTTNNNPLIKLESQDTGQNVSLNDSVGTRLNVPLATSDTTRWSFSVGLDWKHYQLTSFNTNNFPWVITTEDQSEGTQTTSGTISAAQPTYGVELNYLPLAFGLDYSGTDKGGNFSANLGLNFNISGRSEDFANAAYSSQAKAYYGKATLALTREQKLFHNWSLLLRANGQAATCPLISNEQFALGGVASVRGYYEGDEYGDSGWFGTVELRTPLLATRVPLWAAYAPAWLRGSVFIDGGQVFLLDPQAADGATRSLVGAGMGFTANINNHLDMRISVGWPLRDSASTVAGEPRANFSIGGQF